MSARRVAVVSGVVSLAMTLLTASGAFVGLDAAAEAAINPDRSWGEREWRAVAVLDALRPIVLLAVLAVAGLGYAGARRSLAPLVGVGALGVSLVVADRVSSWASSPTYPSGHVLVATVLPAGLLLLAVRRPRWWHWPGMLLLPAVMIAAILVSDTHTASEAVGGLVLGVFVVSAVLVCLRRLGVGFGPEPDAPGSRQPSSPQPGTPSSA